MVDYRNVESKAKELSQKNNTDYYEMLQRFMFERILERISVSKYNDNFILKGGLLLTAMFGIDNRTTKDMDTTITGLNVEKEYDRIYILWDKYIAKRVYAQNIKFGDILSLLLDFLNSNNILVAN